MNTGRFTLPLTLISLAMPALSPAVDLFSESFDSETEAKLENNSKSAGRVTFVDYSDMTVEYLQYAPGALVGDSGEPSTKHFSIPEAPRKIAGSLPTRGVLLQVGYDVAAEFRCVNLVALQEAGEGAPRLDLTGKNYRFRYDVYLHLSPDVTLNANGLPSNDGTTEHVLWGVGYNSGGAVARLYRSSAGNGMWGWLSTEGGLGSPTTGGDAGLMKEKVVAGGWNLGALADNAAVFTPAFGAEAQPVPSAPANQWVEATVTVSARKITVEYKGANGVLTKFFDSVDAVVDALTDPPTDAVSGSVMVGYEDSFNSISFAPGDQWALIDNMVVEEIAAPTLEVNQVAALTTYTGGAQAPPVASFEIRNNQQAQPLTITGLNLSGANPGDFQVLSGVPQTIAPGQTTVVTVQFLPQAPDGVKSAILTVVSDDPQTPAYEISDLKARRSIGGFLEARYKLDETGGTTAADSSGNDKAGGFQVRDPLAFGQPSLLGGLDSGTSIGFTPAQTGTTGNFLTSTVTHTPSYSISLWVRPTETGQSATQTLFERDPDFNSVYNEIYGLRLANGTLSYSAAKQLAVSAPLTSGEVSHVVVTHLDLDGFDNATADRIRIYVNGALMEEKTEEAPGFPDYPLAPTVSSLFFASGTVAGQGFLGEMDDIQIYGAELTPEQVNDMYHRPGVTALDTPPFRILSAVRNPANGGFTVEFPSSPAVSYQLYRSADLKTWIPVGAPTSGTPASATTMLEDPDAPAGTQYYRVSSGG